MHKIRIAVLASGSGSNLQAIIDEIEKGKINGEITAVISDNPGAYALKRAEKHGIEAVYIDSDIYPDSISYNRAIIKELRKRNVGLVVLAGYMKIVSEEMVQEYRNKIINIHPSLIPSFCGMNYYGIKVHNAVVGYGVKVTGATVHFVNSEADEGPVIMQSCVPVSSEDTAQDVQKRVLETEHRILPEAVRLFCLGKLEVNGRIVKIND